MLFDNCTYDGMFMCQQTKANLDTNDGHKIKSPKQRVCNGYPAPCPSPSPIEYLCTRADRFGTCFLYVCIHCARRRQAADARPALSQERR